MNVCIFICIYIQCVCVYLCVFMYAWLPVCVILCVYYNTGQPFLFQKTKMASLHALFFFLNQIRRTHFSPVCVCNAKELLVIFQKSVRPRYGYFICESQLPV